MHWLFHYLIKYFSSLKFSRNFRDNHYLILFFYQKGFLIFFFFFIVKVLTQNYKLIYTSQFGDFIRLSKFAWSLLNSLSNISLSRVATFKKFQITWLFTDQTHFSLTKISTDYIKTMYQFLFKSNFTRL